MQADDESLWHFLQQAGALSTTAFAAAERHGLSPWLSQSPYFDALSPSQQLQVKKRLAREYLQDQQHAIHLQQIQLQLDTQSLRALVIKGAALSRQIYPALGLRCKSDLDLWVDFASLELTRALLQNLGYHAVPANWGRFTQPEQSFVKQDDQFAVRIDLHWEVSSRPLLARQFTFDAIWNSAIEFGFGRFCLAPELIDALLIAVIHRVGHHRDTERWIWLKDIDLLWRRLEAPARQMSISRAAERGVRTLLAEALAASRAIFQTPTTDAELIALSAPASELSAKLLDPRQSMLAIDFQSLSWADFAQLLKEHLLPPPDYMQHRYGAHHGWRRPLNHVKRWISSNRS